MSVKVIAHPETNLVITPSTNNPEFGTIRFDEEHVSMESGFFNKSRRTAFVRGKIVDLESLNLRANQTVGGCIVKKESFEPFYEGQNPKQYPSSHEKAGQSVLTNGKETYLEFVYTADENALDVWVGATSAQVSQETAEKMEEQAM